MVCEAQASSQGLSLSVEREKTSTFAEANQDGIGSRVRAFECLQLERSLRSPSVEAHQLTSDRQDPIPTSARKGSENPSGGGDTVGFLDDGPSAPMAGGDNWGTPMFMPALACRNVRYFWASSNLQSASPKHPLHEDAKDSLADNSRRIKLGVDQTVLDEPFGKATGETRYVVWSRIIKERVTNYSPPPKGAQPDPNMLISDLSAAKPSTPVTVQQQRPPMRSGIVVVVVVVVVVFLLLPALLQRGTPGQMFSPQTAVSLLSLRCRCPAEPPVPATGFFYDDRPSWAITSSACIRRRVFGSCRTRDPVPGPLGPGDPVASDAGSEKDKEANEIFIDA
uniref:Uncharacterized protein n=1 Tax=Anopheles atroparvus TaxID=41427 RepID=A0A182ITC3_ANOAO